MVSFVGSGGQDDSEYASDQDMNYNQRAELRKKLVYPLMCAFEKWIVKYYPQVLPKGRMDRALSYTYSLFHRLSRYHMDGRYRIDNNLVENAIRPLALGRKNYLFCGNHEATENAAIMYSLPGCCKACDVNPREWLTDVLTRIRNITRITLWIWLSSYPIIGTLPKNSNGLQPRL